MRSIKVHGNISLGHDSRGNYLSTDLCFNKGKISMDISITRRRGIIGKRICETDVLRNYFSGVKKVECSGNKCMLLQGGEEGNTVFQIV